MSHLSRREFIRTSTAAHPPPPWPPASPAVFPPTSAFARVDRLWRAGQPG